jgi:hypothetical protein
MRRKKKSQQIDVVAKHILQDCTCAMVNYEHTASMKDYTLFLVYDHRQNNQLEKISRQLF